MNWDKHFSTGSTGVPPIDPGMLSTLSPLASVGSTLKLAARLAGANRRIPKPAFPASGGRIRTSS